MSMESLKKAFEIINSFDPLESDFSGEQSDDLILKAEKALGFTFPPTYRYFVKNYGCGDFRGLEIYGVVSDNFVDSRIPNGIWLTLKKRKQFNIPHSVLIISDTGDGYYYVIDTSKKNADGESPVFVWFVDKSPPTEKVNEDFGDFFLEQVTSSASYEDDDDEEED